MMKGGLGNLMRQAQQMQETMQKAQAELADLEVTGESGAGMVKIVLNGRHEAKKVTIEPKLIGEDLGLLEDLVVAAVNDAVRKIDRAQPGEVCGTHVRNESAAGHEAAVLRQRVDEVHARSRSADRFAALPAGCRSEIRAAHGLLSAGARP